MAPAAVRAQTSATALPLDDAQVDGAWGEVAGRSSHAHPFAAPDWHRTLQRHVLSEADYECIVLRHPEGVVGLTYVIRSARDGSVALGGRQDLVDYFSPVWVEGHGDELADALVAHVLEQGCRRLSAPHLDATGGFLAALAPAGERQGFRLSLGETDPVVAMELPGSWDDYLAGLSSKDRHELRRKRRRLLAAFPSAQVRCSTAATVDEDMDLFIALHTEEESEKGSFLRGWRADFFREMASRLSDDGSLRLAFLEADGEPLAATFGFVDETTYYLYNSTFVRRHHAASPGLFLVSALIQESIERGLRVFDFLKGTENYKFRLGGQLRPMCDAVLELP
jgi:CelD/BcsL family acetyltransferase involved in cellulose biosynthesis